MSYVYTGPIGSSVNGFAAFLSGAVAYFAPVALQSVAVGPVFLNELDSFGGIDVFLQTYGSMTISFQQLRLLDTQTRKALEILVDKNLVNVKDLSPEGLEIFNTLQSKLSENDALSLAQAIDSGIQRVAVDSEEARRLAVELGLRPLDREGFLLDAYKQGLLPGRAILKRL